MKRLGLLIGLLATAAVTQPQWEPYSANLQSRAAAGDATAQFAMGEAFRTGNGIGQDRDQAIGWYRKAAPRDTRAADALGVLLFTKGERKEAIPLLQASAGRRNDYALYILGTARFNGDYVPKDVARAYADMRIAAGTLPQAQRSLALMEPYVTPSDRQRADALVAQAGGPEAGAPAAPAYALAPAPVRAPVPNREVVRPLPAPKAAPRPADDEDRYVARGAVPLPPPPNVTPPDNGMIVAPSAIRAVELPPSAIRAVELPPSQPEASSAPAKIVIAKPVAKAVAASKAAPAVGPTASAWRVQLGAYGSEERAGTQWTALVAKVPQLAKLQKATQPAGALVRLQATGIASRDDAVALCAAVSATGNACFVVGQ